MTDTSLDDLNRRLQRLEDIDEIKRLRMRYHCHINADEFDRIPELFTNDALVDFGAIGSARGRDDVSALFLKIPKHTDLVRQYIHNHLIDVDGDHATGISFLDARYAKDGVALIVAGSFREKYRRQDDGWRISEMKVEIWFGAPLDKGWGHIVRGGSANIENIETFE